MMKTSKIYARDEHIGPQNLSFRKDIVSERPARAVWESDFRAMLKIVRMDAKKGCTRLVQRADKDNPMVIGFYDCGKCAPCLARSILNRKATR